MNGHVQRLLLKPILTVFGPKNRDYEISPVPNNLINLSSNDIETTTRNTLNSDSCPVFIKHTPSRANGTETSIDTYSYLKF